MKHKDTGARLSLCYIVQMARDYRIRSVSLLAGFLFLLGSLSVFAQNGPPVMPQFEADAPKVGEPLPDVTIYDDLGNPVNLRELADENYKVLVLGCLT